MDDIDLRQRHAQPVGDQLRQRRLMPLAMAVGAGQDGDAAGRVDADGAHLIQPGAGAERAHHGRGRDAAGLDIGRDADAAQLAARLGLGPARLEAGVVGADQRLVQRGLVVAAVILQGDRRLVGEGIGRDEVAAADLDLVDPSLPRRDIDQALHQEGRFRPAGAAIGIHRGRYW